MNNKSNNKKVLSPEQGKILLETIKTRFEAHMPRHEGLNWAEVQSRLEAHPEKLWSLNEMERTGGDPDVVSRDEVSGEVVFYDCAPESPEGRRNLCYDREAWEARKSNKPEDNAIDMAAAMGVELLTEEQYYQLQELGEFDTKTSSWLKTPPDVRNLGGAIFGDRRFGRVFISHNGADSYYSSRGFRGVLKV